MLEKITSKYYKRTQMMKFVENAEKMVRKYGWEDRVTYPYRYPIKVTEIIADCKDYDNCTSGTQMYLVSLANGLIDIMNEWEGSRNVHSI